MKVQHSDILIFHSHSFISVAIQFFMNMWRWVGFKFKPFYAEVPNHVAMGDNDNSIIHSIAQGTFIQSINHPSIIHGKKTIKVYSYEWSIKQRQQINHFYGAYEGTPYQYINFIQYIFYILTFGLFWFGGKGEKTANKIYCSELAARILYMVTARELAKSDADHDAHIYFRDYWKVNPLQVETWCKVNCELVQEYILE